MKGNIELEYKFGANGVDRYRFNRAMQIMGPDQYVSPNVSDTFWGYADSVLRHRRVFWGADLHHQELTVKQRTDSKSLKKRIECNLRPPEKPEDVEAFLRAAGYVRQFCLVKRVCEVFKFHDADSKIEAALYTVDCTEKPEIATQTFIEVEVEDARNQTIALASLEDWAEFLDNAFKVGDPINVSLYEMYR